MIVVLRDLFLHICGKGKKNVCFRRILIRVLSASRIHVDDLFSSSVTGGSKKDCSCAYDYSV